LAIADSVRQRKACVKNQFGEAVRKDLERPPTIAGWRHSLSHFPPFAPDSQPPRFFSFFQAGPLEPALWQNLRSPQFLRLTCVFLGDRFARHP